MTSIVSNPLRLEYLRSVSIPLRLEYLRSLIEAEAISMEEIAELQDLVDHIDGGDTLLLQWAGVPEFHNDADCARTNLFAWTVCAECR